MSVALGVGDAFVSLKPNRNTVLVRVLHMGLITCRDLIVNVCVCGKGWWSLNVEGVALFPQQGAAPEFLRVDVVGSRIALSCSSGGLLHVSADRISVGCRPVDPSVKESLAPLPSELFNVQRDRCTVTLTALSTRQPLIVEQGQAAAGGRVLQGSGTAPGTGCVPNLNICKPHSGSKFIPWCLLCLQDLLPCTILL